MSQLMLEGQVDHTASFVSALQKLDARIKELESELAAAKLETAQAKREAGAAMANLRKLLKPWHSAIKQVYGELEIVAEDDAPINGSGSLKWQSWKQKLPGRPAEIIDLLLLHQEMNRNQLMAAMHCGKDVVRVTISRLNVAGLINKNGGKYSLKSL